MMLRVPTPLTIVQLACVATALAAAGSSRAAEPMPAKPVTRQVIRLPEPAPVASSPASAPAAAATEAAESAQLASALPDPVTRIEQVRRGRRVSEVIVSPGGYNHRYVMVNLELRAPSGPTDAVGGLSVPRFVRIDF